MKAAKYNYLRLLRVSFLFICLLASPLFVFSQDQSEIQQQDLSSRFKSLKDESESYNEYKVIKTYNLNTFWKEVEDSLQGYRASLNNAHSEIDQLNDKISGLTIDLENIKGTLADSEARNSTISFFSLEINKALYNTIVWAIIGGLIILAVSLFITAKNNVVVTRKAKKDYRDILGEFEEYRKTSREKQMKLGRELQTERNKLEELRGRMSNKSEKLPTK